MLKGSCLCGAIRYEYDGEIEQIAYCHCSQCRRAQGGAFAANSPIQASLFRLVAGQQYLKEFQTSEVKVRAFCANCGSPIYSARSDKPALKRLRLGSVETPFSCANQYHIYTGSKASWYQIGDCYPQHEESL